MKRNSRLPDIAAAIILVLGLTRMVGYWLDSHTLQGIGAASGVAPFTKVFSATDGYEAFTASFRLRGQNKDGVRHEIALTPERYARLHGPYMRRNVYGAALVFAPRLPEELRVALHKHALNPGSAMWRELDLPTDWVSAEIHIQPREGSLETTWIYPMPSP